MSIIATLPLRQIAQTKITGSPQTAISFSGLTALAPAGTKHLVVEVSGAQSYSQRRFCEVTINGDTGAIYGRRDFQAAGTAVSTQYYLNQTVGQGVDIVPAAANQFSGGYILFPYCFRTDNSKSWQTMGSSLEQRLHRHIGVWNDTAAIGSITLRPWQDVPSANPWSLGTTVTLYAVDEDFLVEEKALSADGVFTFNSFPATGNHLLYLMHLRTNYVNAAYMGDRVYHQINGDTTTANYRIQRFGGEKIPDNEILDQAYTEQRLGWSSELNSPANAYGSLVCWYPEYRARSFSQPWFSQHGTFDETTYFPVSQENGRWQSSAGLTQIRYFPKNTAGLYKAGSRIGAYRPSNLTARQVVGAGGAASVSLAVPAGAKALRCLVVARTNANDVEDRLGVTLNGDTNLANYTSLRASARNSTHEAAATDNEIGALPGATAPANTFGCGVLTIPQHAATDRHKHLLSAIGAAGGRLALVGGRWRSSAAVTSLTFTPKVGTRFEPGSVFELSFAG